MEHRWWLLQLSFWINKELGLIKEEMAMTILGQMIWDDAMEKGMEKGIEKGRKEESERYSRLILKLTEDNKTDLLIKTASDRSTEKLCIKNTVSEIAFFTRIVYHRVQIKFYQLTSSCLRPAEILYFQYMRKRSAAGQGRARWKEKIL